MATLDQFLIIEKKVGELFLKLNDTSKTESELLSVYLENKGLIDQIKAALEEVVQSDDMAIKSKAEELLKRMKTHLEQFASKHLNIGVKVEEPIEIPVEPQTPKLPDGFSGILFDTSTNSVVIGNGTLEAKIPVSHYLIVEDDKIIDSFKCTVNEMLGYINNKYGVNSDSIPTVYECKQIQLKSKTVFAV